MNAIKFLFNGVMKFKLNLWRTIYTNFHCLPFKQAIKMPIAVFDRSKFILKDGGRIEFNCDVRPGLLRIGRDILYGQSGKLSQCLVCLRDGVLRLNGVVNIGCNAIIDVREQGVLEI